MKGLLLLVALLSLSSCNTTIGIGRDIKEGYQWSKRKIEENRNGGSGGGDHYDYNAPVY